MLIKQFGFSMNLRQSSGPGLSKTISFSNAVSNLEWIQVASKDRRFMLTITVRTWLPEGTLVSRW